MSTLATAASSVDAAVAAATAARADATAAAAAAAAADARAHLDAVSDASRSDWAVDIGAGVLVRGAPVSPTPLRLPVGLGFYVEASPGSQEAVALARARLEAASAREAAAAERARRVRSKNSRAAV